MTGAVVSPLCVFFLGNKKKVFGTTSAVDWVFFNTFLSTVAFLVVCSHFFCSVCFSSFEVFYRLFVLECAHVCWCVCVCVCVCVYAIFDIYVT
jgi:hypothetical protein